MINSNSLKYNEAYVWIWLPGHVEPVVAGKLTPQGNTLVFNYGQSYLARDEAIAIFDPELPLKSGLIPLLPGMNMPSCIRDGSPDAWGRRVIINKKYGNSTDVSQLDELTYLLESGSDRIGALDFQSSPSVYEPRLPAGATLDELVEAADLIQTGKPLSPQLAVAINHGTSIGGARPKVLIEDNEKKYVAKFSVSTDLYSIVKAEYITMKMAHLCGLDVAKVKLVTSSHKDILLIERFDRVKSAMGWQRKSMVSALTMLELDEMLARYASYENLAEIIRYRFVAASSTLKELFGRITFNILTGNTDDHARNHSAFWDGHRLSLTPAYDLCPQGRAGNEASQAMLIWGVNRASKISTCLNAAHIYMLTEKEALAVIEQQLIKIGSHWSSLCDEAELNEIDRKLMYGRQYINPFAFEDLEGKWAFLKDIANDLYQIL